MLNNTYLFELNDVRMIQLLQNQYFVPHHFIHLLVLLAYDLYFWVTSVITLSADTSSVNLFLTSKTTPKEPNPSRDTILKSSLNLASCDGMSKSLIPCMFSLSYSN